MIIKESNYVNMLSVTCTHYDFHWKIKSYELQNKY